MPSKQVQLENRIEQLENTLRALGFTATETKVAERPEDRADFILPGSPKHAAFLGLIEVKEDDVDGRIAHTSSKTDVTYVLEDEVTPFMTFSDPGQVARLVLRQKVSEFESPWKIPIDAPPLWQPRQTH